MQNILGILTFFLAILKGLFNLLEKRSKIFNRVESDLTFGLGLIVAVILFSSAVMIFLEAITQLRIIERIGLNGLIANESSLANSLEYIKFYSLISIYSISSWLVLFITFKIIRYFSSNSE